MPTHQIVPCSSPRQSLERCSEREWEYSKGEVGHLDYDPWLGGQDGEIGKPVRFSVETESPDTAIVSMSYPFVLRLQAPA